MCRVVDIRKVADPKEVVREAVHLLTEGRLVAFPTETVYLPVALSVNAPGVERLRAPVNGSVQAGFPLLISGQDSALDFAPRMSQLAKKLAKRCWPGPVAIAVNVAKEDGLLSQLPVSSQNMVIHQGRVQFRVPAHEVVHAVLRQLPAPLVTVNEAPAKGMPAAATARAISERFGKSVPLIVDDGACRYGEPATVVGVAENRWQLLNPGVVSETMLGRLSSEMYLFVCTGNTCRSPMAEALFRKMLAERLECPEDELADRGYIVASAGLAAVSGAPASPDAVDAMARRGADMSTHESQPITERLLDQADYLFTMTRGHSESILAARPEMADRVQQLNGNGSDVMDPIGGSVSDYEQCALEIEGHVRKIVERIELA